MTDLPPAVQRVQRAAQMLGLDVGIRMMPASTRTAEEAAAACGCAVGQIVKSLIFRGRNSGTPYLLLVSGANRVNEGLVAQHCREPIARPNAEFVRETTGFAIGGIPPLGHTRALRTYMDKHLLQYAIVWAAAGTPNAVFAASPAALRDTIKPEIIALS